MHHAGIAIAKARLSNVYLNRSVNNSEIYTPEEALNAGFLDRLVDEEKLLSTAEKIGQMFTQLNFEAHKETKLRVRKQQLDDLRMGIEFDYHSKISLNPS